MFHILKFAIVWAIPNQLAELNSVCVLLSCGVIPMSLLTITLENKTKKLLQRIGTTTIFLPDPSMQLNEAQQQVTL